MESKNFLDFRKRLGRTQKELAALLGVSLGAVSSYEQNTRAVPPHIERHILYLISLKQHPNAPFEKCWKMLSCPKEQREHCPAWEFKSGTQCWLINGTICHGHKQKTWREKIEICYNCEVLQRVLRKTE
ncbi:helix-turn-helix domain-containing protein [Desulfotalea psychrophila]|uniref:helix-turn-helix domain-containing protein n=1 Tax=Desulfotalea psychrophila TaxID=84980 RepID=UPI0002EEF5B2|nr:helix-turn-helix transcriptional regulator [Desulfotalea psychrophila]